MPCSCGGGEADVEGGRATFAVLLEDVGAVELVGRELDHPRVRRGRAVVDHEDHGLGRGGSHRDERLEDRFELVLALGANGNDDEGRDGFHGHASIGRPQRELECRELTTVAATASAEPRGRLETRY